MPDSIAGLLEKADLAVAAAAGLAGEHVMAPVAIAGAMLRRRLDLPEDLLLVGFAGGTGSGKSSLVNAIAGSEVAVVGGLRPTTERPLGVASPVSSTRIEAYLSDIGVDEVAVGEMPDWLCLIDMPDTDSVELSHRLQVESLVPRLDVIVWVVDPEKYRDSSLHHGYLSRLAMHADRFVFVLNQFDRLSAEVGTMLLSDFRQALLDDGIDAPVVLATAADPTAGPPDGIEELVDELRSRRSSGVLSKALSDLDDAARALLEGLGPAGLDFERRSGEVTSDAATALTDDAEEDASDLLVAFLEMIAADVGGVAGERVRAIALGVPRDLRQIVEAAGRASGETDSGRGGGAPSSRRQATDFEESVSSRVVGPVRQILRARATAVALATDLAMSVTEVRSKMGV